MATGLSCDLCFCHVTPSHFAVFTAYQPQWLFSAACSVKFATINIAFACCCSSAIRLDYRLLRVSGAVNSIERHIHFMLFQMESYFTGVVNARRTDSTPGDI
jgi:hypothetical protein